MFQPCSPPPLSYGETSPGRFRREGGPYSLTRSRWCARFRLPYWYAPDREAVLFSSARDPFLPDRPS